MSQNHTLTQAGATPTILDTKGKGKEKDKEADPSAHTSESDVPADNEEDIWGEYPLEAFPSPPADGFWHVRQANDDAATPAASNKFNPPLDPPLMALTYPPLPPLANDPKWYSTMLSEVHRNRAHLNSQLELAQAEAAAALTEVTLAQIELSAELDQMQNFVNRIASVAGKNVVRKLVNSVKWAMEHGEDDESEEERQDADDEDSSGDDDAGEEHQADAKNENSSASGDEREDEQGSDDENSCNGSEAESRFQNGSRKRPIEEDEGESTKNSPRTDQPNADNESCGRGDDARSRGSSQSPSPILENSSRKRPREEDDDDETSSPNSSPRKKFKGKHVADPNSFSPQHYAAAASDDDDAPAPQHVWCPEDDEIDPEPNSDEEYEVEDSLLLVESEPVTPPLLAGPYIPRSLLDVSRDPRRLRQNSRGEAELYIPGR
ncbi:hypothetical protein K503DRAFT_774495 [Rhizopogon vinicolor AM-OR11-026]|uniref:Uncharacterized protein n=1 Tax=Rhizopogon vinicolor AM-OR11-026 TaxID=1314800 RepID=A0A1B7MPE6_9AGAM|nr:hypothetical protein K503DRAFT_774495 [Rhizopogon vinicolor AM-OR11-026]